MFSDDEPVDYENFNLKRAQLEEMDQSDKERAIAEMNQSSDLDEEIRQSVILGLDGKTNTYPGVDTSMENVKHFEVDRGEEMQRLMLRHRLDFAKLFFEKDGGYTIREFKQIYLKEIRENPDKYFTQDPSSADEYDYSVDVTRPDLWQTNPLNYKQFIQNSAG